jgi:glycerophosphoryl diester phosphodiesterase
MNRVTLLVSAYLVILGSVHGQSTHAVSNESAESWPVVIAHRGASGYLPEHTTEAAAYAHAQGADYIEQDCVVSKDNVPVVLHDITLDLVTNVADVFPDRRRGDHHWYVFDFTLEELRRLNVRERYRQAGFSRFPAGRGRFQIATLREHIELIRGLDQSRRTATGFYIELMEPARHHAERIDVAASVLKVLNESGLDGEDDLTYLQCFDERELRRLRVDLKCRLPLIQLCRTPPTEQQIREYARFADGLGISIDCVISGMTSEKDPGPIFTDVIRLSHENAMQVHVWTVQTDRLPKSAESVDQLLDWLVQGAGADGIFSDHPDAILRWRASRSPQIRTGPFQLIRKRKE